MTLVTLGKKSEAIAEFRQAIVVLEKLTAEVQDVPDYRYELGRCHINLGHVLGDLGKRSEAEQEYCRR